MKKLTEEEITYTTEIIHSTDLCPCHIGIPGNNTLRIGCCNGNNCFDCWRTALSKLRIAESEGE